MDASAHSTESHAEENAASAIAMVSPLWTNRADADTRDLPTRSIVVRISSGPWAGGAM